MREIVFTFAEPAEEEAIRKLLMDAKLPVEDFARHLQHFLVAKQNGTLIGVIGLETYEELGLLRSLVVAPPLPRPGSWQKALRESVFLCPRTGDKRVVSAHYNG